MKEYYMLNETESLFDVFREIQPNFNVGNAIKYIVRAPKKHKEPLMDLEKAIDYIEEELRFGTGETQYSVSKYLFRDQDYWLDEWQRIVLTNVMFGEYEEAITEIKNRIRIYKQYIQEGE